MKIYTKTGDRGETGLFGGTRISKSSPRIEAYGTVDELNSFIGLAITEAQDGSVKSLLNKIQNQLFIVGSDLATPKSTEDQKKNILRIPAEFHEEIEKSIDSFEEKLDELKNFIIPGGSKSASLLHICRTISRRAERRVVALNSLEQINENIVIFLNRLSDLFFVLSRYENKVSNHPDVIWESQKSQPKSD
ncbi:MAG: cob(I)yrinic acid a,c-diamide adenosyltransferase [Ignavibacteriaceae bacterium]|jgi:cob(I)alamin adenosyltransferase